MFFIWPADTLLLVWLLLLHLQCTGNSRKIIANKQKHVVSASFFLLFYPVRIPRDIYLRYQTSHKSLLWLMRSGDVKCQEKKACLFVLMSGLYCDAAKFYLKIEVQLISIVIVAVLPWGCPHVAEFQKCSHWILSSLKHLWNVSLQKGVVSNNLWMT